MADAVEHERRMLTHLWIDDVSTSAFYACGLAHMASTSLTLSLESIKDAAGTIAYGMAKYYHGNESGQTPGILPQPYYWWECGAMFNSLINYWYYTGDTTYNDIVEQGMLFQVGPLKDYMVPNQTSSEGKDHVLFV
nr:mannan endo-1,6-alpha-mannosidase dcw1 [Quercus suber]